ncbi:hypothetical protein ACRALDRAFT_212410 [Sodiomyces alcalophilus JCM 7366]|uniref:uncharacterized protein n=1 Tax=Sodiomyces alcalophilus JCM 7366 TaxID=591952 RepID=UPI0039B64060
MIQRVSIAFARRENTHKSLGVHLHIRRNIFLPPSRHSFLTTRHSPTKRTLTHFVLQLILTRGR